MNTPYTSKAHPETDFAPQRPRTLQLWTALALVAAWVALISRFGKGDVYAVMGPYACLVSVVCLLLSPRALLAAFVCDRRGLLWGIAVGVLMTALTYPAYQLALDVMPGLEAEVQTLYHGARSTSLREGLLWVSTLVIAEEVLFRGVLPRALRLVVPKRAAFALAVLAYALAQLGSGSWIVFMLALVCGTIWTVLRVHTRSLTPSVIAHGIWTPTLILLLPVTSSG